MFRMLKKLMKKVPCEEKGFTMIELILVIVVLGILATTALPYFYDTSTQAAASAEAGVLGSVRSGIALYKSNALVSGISPTLPADVDALGAGTTCSSANPCFGTVLSDPITDGRWVKSAARVYTWAQQPGGAVVDTFTYDNVAGSFK
jgi:prepilin-type N-terminal cleavage/methylation domain-containing protein